MMKYSRASTILESYCFSLHGGMLKQPEGGHQSQLWTSASRATDVRVIRDYGMIDRNEAPQFNLPAVKNLTDDRRWGRSRLFISGIKTRRRH